MTSAEKQQRYREHDLGVHGSKERIQLFISVQTKAQLGRLAHHHGYTVTLRRSPGRERAGFLDFALERADTRCWWLSRYAGC